MIQLNALAGGLFILTVFGIVAMRQVIGILRLFVVQSILLACSAFIIGYEYSSIHLFMVAGITIITKAILIPWIIYHLLSHEIHARREIIQVISIPTSLLIAAGLVICSYFMVDPLLSIRSGSLLKINLPIGVAGLFIGGYAVIVRREALPQLFGLLTMENGAFLAGACIAPDLPLMAELAAAFDVLIIAFVVGLLTRNINKHTGTTLVGRMTSLKEE